MTFHSASSDYILSRIIHGMILCDSQAPSDPLPILGAEIRVFT